jgi:hypothetical protein
MTPPPTKQIAVYMPPAGRRVRVRPAAASYCLKLEREGDGQILHQWSGIPHDKIGPLLTAMQNYLPWLAKAAAAKAAFDRVMDLLR